MVPFRVLAGLLVLLLSTPLCAKVKEGQTAPDFGLRDLFDESADAKSYWVSDFVGPEAAENAKKALLISFCHSSCKACWIELPELLGLKVKYGARGFEVWSILVDTDPEGREKGKQKLAPARGKIVVTRTASTRMPNEYMGTPWEMPALFLIDRNGKVVRILHEYKPDELKALDRQVEELVGE